MEYTGTASAYIVFQVYSESDVGFFDNENSAELSYVNLNYWYKNPADMAKAKQIKSLMKQAGFYFDGSQDLKDNGFYGKSFDFIFKAYL
jgi:hypothetical protein